MQTSSFYRSLLILIVTLSACAVPSPGPSPSATGAQSVDVTQSLTDCIFTTANDPITQGSVEFTALNQTDGQVNFDILRLRDGSTYDQLAEDVSNENVRAEAGQEGLGPPSYVDFVTRLEVAANSSGSTVTPLSGGSYAVVCTNLLYAPEGRMAWFITRPFQVE